MSEGTKEVVAVAVWCGVIVTLTFSCARYFGAARKAELARAEYWHTLAEMKRPPWMMLQGQATATDNKEPSGGA